jgi:hypothetical protein
MNAIPKGLAVLVGSALAAVVVSQADDLAQAQSSVPCGAHRFPNFDRTLLLETTSETSANASIGDLTGNGNLDVVLAKGRHWPLVSRVLLNDGHGRFPVAHDLNGATPYRSYSAVLADVNGDGALDIVVGNDAPDPKVVYLNDGKGSFRLGSTFGRPEWPTRNVAVADLNGDGLPDIIVANRYGDTGGANYVCLNRGGRRFDAHCIAFSHESATTITAADFNGDGFIDLAVPNRDVGQSYVYLNDGRANFSKRTPFGPPDATIRMVAAADLTGSGRLDIVAIDDGGDLPGGAKPEAKVAGTRLGTFIYFNRGDGTFSPAVPLDTRPATPYALAVGDLNRDGKVDVVVGYVAAPSVVYFNDGTGRSFAPVPLGDGKVGVAFGIAIGDLDKDGWPDIVVAHSNAPNAAYFNSGVPRCEK